MERAINAITGQIVDAAYKAHTGLGPGLLESVYETVVARDLESRGFQVERQKGVSFEYKGMHFKDCLRVDLLVERRVIVEVKSVEKLVPLHTKQLLTYLRLCNLRTGLLVNFGALRLKDGLHRILNGFDTDSVPPCLCENHTPAATSAMQ
jgi:iron complex transport system substrate-binding protein